MNAKNNEEVIRAIIRFSLYLSVSVIIAVGCFSFFMKTAGIEVNKIIAKTGNYDEIQMHQIRMTESIDSVYHYSALLNSEVGLNYSAMYNLLNNRTFQLNNELDQMNPADCILYKKLAGEISTFFSVKDSIRRANSDLEILRNDYVRCMTRNRELSRQLYTRGIY